MDIINVQQACKCSTKKDLFEGYYTEQDYI